MLWTRIPTARLAHFVDQAVLYLHLPGPADATSEDGDPDQARTLLARHGIRTATDLERAYTLAGARSEEEGEKLLGLLDAPGLAVHRLRLVMDAMEDDEWMVYVRNWRDQGSPSAPVGSVEEFVGVSAAQAGSWAAPSDAEVDFDDGRAGSARSEISLAAG